MCPHMLSLRASPTLPNRQYLARYFSEEERSKSEALVADLKSAFIERLEVQEWMDAATKGEASRLEGYLTIIRKLLIP